MSWSQIVELIMNVKNSHLNPQGEKQKEGHCCNLHLLSTADCRLTLYTHIYTYIFTHTLLSLKVVKQWPTCMSVSMLFMQHSERLCIGFELSQIPNFTPEWRLHWKKALRIGFFWHTKVRIEQLCLPSRSCLVSQPLLPLASQIQPDPS